jgi:hypothetical protein
MIFALNNQQMVAVGLSAPLAGRTVDGCLLPSESRTVDGCLLPPETAEITQGDQFVLCVLCGFDKIVVAFAGQTQQPKVTT